jgi:tRNA-splicing ligase RtcB
MFEKLKKIAPATYLLPQENGMKVPGLIIGTEALLNDPEMLEPLKQVANVAHLPGIMGHSIAMPDMHWGYGFPIGGVAAMNCQTGVISPGGVGYDINCGVRLAIVPEKYSSFSEKTKEAILQAIFRHVPSGVGYGHRGEKGLSFQDYQELTKKGALWSIEQGFGFIQDLEHIESKGVIEGSNINVVSSHAQERGKKQLGTLGSGNHFIEIGEILHIHDLETAHLWNVFEGQTYILIHSGSRGFGHQICQDTLNSFIKKGFAKDLPDKQLVCAPIHSKDGETYFQAMAAAANFAFNNRQQMLHAVRKAFLEICNISPEKIALVYDVCHNIAKFETHLINNVPTKLCIHRKGATRALGPNSTELPSLYQKTGQPVLVPGDMGRASYLLAGLGNPLTFNSCCHGAGRAKSRVQSMKSWKGKDLKEHMHKQGVQVLASSYSTIAEEMPDAYKDVDLVVAAVEEAKLAKIVAKLKPHQVIKG